MANLFKIIPQKRKLLILSLGLVLLFALVPLHSAQAAWWDTLIEAVRTISNVVGAVWAWGPGSVILLPILIGSYIFALLSSILFLESVLLLKWVVSGLFITLPFTSGGIVDAGWDATQTLANMGFILVLVFIALATILRLESYGLKRLLPKFLIVILLINFSKVITGAVIDIANIVTQEFLDFDIIGSFVGLFNPFQQQVNNFRLILNGEIAQAFLSQIRQVLTLSGLVDTVLRNALAGFFGIFAGFVIFLYFVLFLIRYIVIWLLVILAPLAWFCWILPLTQKYWRMWWSYLLQWAFVGAIAGFFLKLGGDLITRIGTGPSGAAIQPDLTRLTPPWDLIVALLDPLFAIINSFFVLFAVLAFLIIGFIFSIKLSGGGTDTILRWGEKGLKAAGGAATAAAQRRLAGPVGSKAVAGLEATGKWAARLEKSAQGKAWAPLAKPLAWVTRGTESLAAPPIRQYIARMREVPKKDLEAIDNLAPVEAEATVNEKTQMLPPELKKQHLLQYWARMAEKETLEFTGFAGEEGPAATLANEALENKNLYYQKEAHSILKSTGGISEEALVQSKLVGMPDRTPDERTARDKKEQEIREEIKKTRDTIQNRLGEEDLTIEAGLKLKYITKDEADKDKVAALAKTKAEATAKGINIETEKEAVLTAAAAGAQYVKEFKPEDVKKIIDPKNLATRIGITLGNPRNLQKIQDNFGIKALKDMIEGRGGLNEAMATPDKLDQYAQDNPRMVRAVFTSPAYRELDVEGRNQMRDLDGNPTTDFDEFEIRTRILKRLKAHPKLENRHKVNEMRLQAMRELKRSTGAEKERLEKEIEKSEAILKSLDMEIENNLELKKASQEIERLKKEK